MGVKAALEDWLGGPGYKHEFRVWATLAWPVSVGLGLRLGMMLTDTAFLGHLGTHWLAAGSVAQVWMALSGNIVVRGLAGAVNTLGSQAYGAGNLRLAALWARFSIIVNCFAMIPIFGLWWWGDRIFMAVNLPTSQATDAAVFLRWSLIGQLGFGISTTLIFYHQAKHNVIVPLLIGLGGFIGNIVLNQVLIHGAFGWSGLGFIGSPIATSISRVLAAFVLGLYTLYEENFVSKQELPSSGDYGIRARWTTFFGQAVPQIVQTLLEEWQLQVVAYFAIRLGPIAIATHNATLMLFLVLTAASYGVLSATGVRIGHHLGANHVKKAIAAAKIGLLALLVIGAILAVVILSCRDYIGYIFSHDQEVVSLMSELMLPLGIGVAFLALFYATMAILSGQGRPIPIGIAFVLGAWVVSVPLAYVLSEVANMGLPGIWYALCVGYATVTAVTGIAVWRSDWEECARVAAKRSEAEGKTLLGSINE